MSNEVTQKEFYNEIQEFRKELHQVTVAMAETKMLIRDYNGLRQTINSVDDRVQQLEGNAISKREYREYLGWLVGVISTLLVIFAYAR